MVGTVILVYAKPVQMLDTVSLIRDLNISPDDFAQFVWNLKYDVLMLRMKPQLCITETSDCLRPPFSNIIWILYAPKFNLDHDK